MVYKFCSTSKISFPGSGVAAIAASANNLEDIKKQLTVQTIGYDKVKPAASCKIFQRYPWHDRAYEKACRDLTSEI